MNVYDIMHELSPWDTYYTLVQTLPTHNKRVKEKCMVTIQDSDITDVSHLWRAHTLTFKYSPNIKDVSALGGVHTLTLWDCESIEDVSALGGVHTLKICGRHNVTDISALGVVHTLSITWYGYPTSEIKLW